MFPPMAILIPVMIMWSAFKMIDTWYGLVLVYGVITFPFVVWLMKSFFDEVPRELDEAAIVDGSSNWGAFVKGRVALGERRVSQHCAVCLHPELERLPGRTAANPAQVGRLSRCS
jgi:ABC-type sulfate transport system permease subunit